MVIDRFFIFHMRKSFWQAPFTSMWNPGASVFHKHILFIYIRIAVSSYKNCHIFPKVKVVPNFLNLRLPYENSILIRKIMDSRIFFSFQQAYLELNVMSVCEKVAMCLAWISQ